MNKTAEGNTKEIQELLIRMERNNNLVQRLSRKLNSYTCEPNNRSCFEKLDNLRRSFRVFKDQQNHLLRLLHQKKEQTEQMEGQIKLHLQRFKDLEKEIAAYILTTNKYQ
ncbi:hypothetical protein GTQ34_03115 [Muricauda sp. JGD-17]|uniref:Uncharacterized protein n=1 Tax=Flagellimonas ochracea TaxID=2696472 RepID=A0A964TAX1_9FLAO|nr:hypothetical protein [Allomuricauda ochracea]NAY90899.1 hypothetical protein [Allomuricauda ochracea]